MRLWCIKNFAKWKETHLAEEGDREGGGRDDLGQEEEEHGEGEEDGDGEGDLLPRVRRQVEHQHCDGIAHPVSPITMMQTGLCVQQFDRFQIKLLDNTQYRTLFYKLIVWMIGRRVNLHLSLGFSIQHP
jgi:hypothetical protein